MKKQKQIESVRTSITLPSDFLDKVDKARGDIPRSKYILNLLKNVYYNEHDAEWTIKQNFAISYL
jgi:metal-responsive CopG/Arc/MetJ family transcriptional regulator